MEDNTRPFYEEHETHKFDSIESQFPLFFACIAITAKLKWVKSENIPIFECIENQSYYWFSGAMRKSAMITGLNFKDYSCPILVVRLVIAINQSVSCLIDYICSIWWMDSARMLLCGWSECRRREKERRNWSHSRISLVSLLSNLFPSWGFSIWIWSSSLVECGLYHSSSSSWQSHS